MYLKNYPQLMKNQLADEKTMVLAAETSMPMFQWMLDHGAPISRQLLEKLKRLEISEMFKLPDEDRQDSDGDEGLWSRGYRVYTAEEAAKAAAETGLIKEKIKYYQSLISNIENLFLIFSNRYTTLSTPASSDNIG